MSLINLEMRRHRKMRSVNRGSMIQVTIYNNYFCCQQNAVYIIYIYYFNSGINVKKHECKHFVNKYRKSKYLKIIFQSCL